MGESVPMAPKLQTIAILSSLIAIFLLPSSASFFSDNNGRLHLPRINQQDFDYFVLSLQWPPTNCRNTHHCCKTNACCSSSGRPQRFTIHGLWCNYNDGSWPSCCGDNNFDEKEISTIRKALDEYWPTLFCGSTSTCHGNKGSFYAHEWGKHPPTTTICDTEKHGTCSASVSGDEYNYFLLTLNIYFKYNVTEVLNEAGYTPSNSEKYPLGGIIAAIENAFHTSPLIVCSVGAIQEIRLCFYKDFKTRDCAVTSGSVGNVDSSESSCPEYVSLPAHLSSGTNDETFSEVQPDVEAQ